jgi:RluA family pseudouridine synthase
LLKSDQSRFFCSFACLDIIIVTTTLPMFLLKTHTVPANVSPARLSDYACGIFEQLPSRKGVKKAIKKGAIRLNGNPADTGRWVQPHDVITLVDLEETPPKNYEFDLEIVYEDDHLAIINKPAGVKVSGNQYRTIVNMLPDNVQASPLPDALKWAKPVHRLDVPTSGLLMVAKTAQAHMHLGQQLEQKTIKKTYHAIVKGTPAKQGHIRTPIGTQSAHSEFEVLQTISSLQSGTLSLVRLSPHTGRTHQLRIHMAGLGHPIMGDTEYDEANQTIQHKGLFLAATSLQLAHPALDKNLEVSIDLPHKFTSLLEREVRRWEKFKGGENSL